MTHKPENLENLFELSPLQQGVLFHHLLEPAGGAYVEQLVFTFRGALRTDLFRRAWQAVIDRHPALRASFFWEGLEKPLQAVHRQVAVPLEELDWRGLAAEQQSARLAALLREDRRRGFAPGAAPLLRLSLFQVAGDGWWFLFRFSHLIMDGWSMGLVLADFAASYQALWRGGAAALPPSRPYGDFIAWLRRRDLARAEAFWRRSLAGLTAPTRLDLGCAGEAVPPGEPTHQKLELDLAHLAGGLRDCAQRCQVTLNTLVQGGWSLLLGRLTGEEEVIAGATVACRPPELHGAEGIVGLMIETLPVRARVDGGASTLPWLRQFQAAQVEIRQHGSAPLVRIQEWSDAAKGTPLFESIVVFENVPIPDVSLRDEGLEIVDVVYDGRPHYPISLMLFMGQGLTLRATWDRRRYDAAAMRALLGRLETLLLGIVADPSRTIAELPLLSRAERHQLTVEWNDTGRAHAGAGWLPLLFERQAASTPEAVAVSAPGRHLTYRELAARAGDLARHLRRHGVGPEVLVGLCVERTPEMVVALLAILEAGGAYLPLDPTHPPERLALVLADSGAAVLLADEALLARLPPHGARVVGLRRDGGEIAGTPAAAGAAAAAAVTETTAGAGAAPGTRMEAESLAYVLYTSGSTGRPKGVQLPHRAVVNFLRAMGERPGLGSGDVLPAITTLAFDIAGLEIYLPLAVGGRVEVVGRETAADGELLAGRIAAAGATAMQATPATWRLLVDAGWPGRPGFKALCGGEALPPELARELLERGVELWNLYGPTETAIWSAACPVAADSGAVLLGRPIANTRFHVAGRDGELVPPGLAGELRIGGLGLARGYLGQAGLTAERFVPDPWSGEPGARLYRTGDLVRQLRTGELAFLGRLDHQVKVRGFRIELGEIESALGRHPAVRRAVVIARGEPGARRLLAYLAPQAPPAAELRELLARSLPDYMVPSQFIGLDAFPLTPHGKVDRAALPEADGAAGEPAAAAPRTPAEEALAGIWAETLRRRRVGVHDNFFELGGHSLLATQVASRVRAAFGVELPLQRLFERPTVAALAAAIEAEQRERAGWRVPPIATAPRTAEMPLAFAQERMWFLQRLDPASPAYTLASAARLCGALDRGVLERCCAEIVRRHEALRTTFPEVLGQPVQTVQPFRGFALPVIDLHRLPPAEREAEALRLAVRERDRPFDLAAGPPLRIRLVAVAARRHLLLVAMHHIVCDGWSMGVLAREMTALFDAFSAGAPSPLPELAVQVADFAVWQRRWLAGEVLAGQLAYWRRQLAGAPPRLELPADRPRPADQGHRGARLAARLPRDLEDGLATLGSRHALTPFMTLLAGFAALLGRLSGTDDLLLGTPIANRQRLEIEPLIGAFVNTLVLRIDLAGAPSFVELAGRVRATALAAYAHQDLPFEKLVLELAPERSLGSTPLFQVMFAFLAEPPRLARLGEATVEPIEVPGGAAAFDLTLAVSGGDGAGGEGLTAQLEYGADLFDAATMARLWRHFESLLRAILADPRRPVGQLTLLSAAERHQLLVEWGRGEEHGEAGAGLLLAHELFERQAERTPAAVALACGGRTVRYDDLDRRAGRLAGRLRRLGMGPERLVGLLAERTPAMVAGMLAILESGAGWVPLDPEDPPARLALIAADAGLDLVLAQQRLAGRLPAAPCAVLALDDDGEALDEVPAARPAATPAAAALSAPGPGAALPRGGSGALPASIAYVMYTSGSSGRPKGVAVPHAALAGQLAWLLATFPLDAGDRVLQKAAFTFDTAVEEILLPLAAGARLVLAAPGGGRDLDYLVRTLAGEAITFLDVTPSLLAALLEHPHARSCTALRRVLSGGEALAADLCRRCFATLPAELYNTYGPTEATIQVAVHRCRPGEEEVPLGRPVTGIRLHVLDAELRPVPIGVVGEICAAGAGLARGYLRQPGATAAAFVPLPGGGPGERLYRTGDLGRFDAAGRLLFAGRRDQQVKLRGFRIEPGEIEAALREHRGVREAVVEMVRRDPGGRLAAWVVAAPGWTLEARELRSFLAARLPGYMVPAAFVILAALPIGAGGKLDRRALPPPETQPGEAPPAAPRDQAEALMCGIWREVLRLPRVGVHDNFFELGGHSLIATRMVSRVRAAFGVEMPLRLVFERPQLAALAAAANALRREDTPAPLPPVGRVARGAPLPLSFAQERLWFLDQLEPRSAAYIVAGALRLRRQLRPGLLAAAFAAIVRRHEVLRTRFEAVDGEPRQTAIPGGAVPLPVVELGGLTAAARAAELRRQARDEAGRPFDLARDSLLRLRLWRLAPGEHVLLLALHHIVVDGWSMQVLVREVSALYAAALAGRPSPLPDLPCQYADYACWQRQRLQGELLARELDHWRSRLAGAPQLSVPPPDRPRRLPPDRRGGDLPVTLAPEAAAALAGLSRRHAATPFMTLLAGFQLLLARWSGEEDVVVGSPVTNRQRPELEELVGFFANTLVLRARVRGSQSFAALLAAVRETTLDAFAHQELPFERLVAELGPERNLGASPLFQAMLALENAPATALVLPGLEIEPMRLPSPAARLDLTLALAEGTDGGWRGHAEYAAELFDRTTIVRLVEQLQRLLAAAAAAPDTPAAALRLLSGAERHQLQVEWNDSEVAWPAAGCLHELIAAQAERTPDAVAVTAGEQALSYRELRRQAGRLARRLRDLGVGPEVVVAVLAQRCTALPVLLLAVLEAGGAYLPLDPDYPGERLGLMLEDSAAAVLLLAGGAGEPPGLAGRGRARRLALELPAAADAGAPRARPGAADPDAAAYVIYTSGSTGRPKGVVNTHRAIVNRLLWMQSAYPLGPGDRVLQKTPISFDVSVWELFWPLLSGACMVLAAPGGHRDSAYLVELIAAAEITTLHFVPSLLAAFLDEDEVGRCRSLARVMASGEALPAELARRFAARLGGPCGATLSNLYGPTEAAVDVTSWICRPGEEAEREGVPIGRPIANLRLHLLDAAHEPVGVGAVGELVLGGVGLARGYLGQPERTAERFVPDPYGGPEGAGGRLYRTGDLVRALAGGAVEYLGRADHQVKVRGVRIELGEIEAALIGHAGVRAAAVGLDRGKRSGGLDAYVVRSAGQEVEAAELRAHLRRQLPESMVPSRFWFLPALPLTPSDKVDRASLPALAAAEEEQPAFEPPRNAAEAALAAMWQELLGLPRIGVHDDFFALGGHSLSAVKLVHAVRRAWDVELPVRALFEAPTVSALAAAIGERRRWRPRRAPGAQSEAGGAGGGVPVMTAAELAAEAVLDRRIQPRPASPRPATAGPPDLLLTGGTGFFGAYLLRELLRQRPRARVHCLVRAADGAEGLARLRRNLAAHRLWEESFAGRIAAVPGDLAQPLLGLAPERFARLAGEVEAIFHNAAWANMFHAYSTLRRTNVLGTQEVLRLAVQGRCKPLHYVSTVSVLSSLGDRGAEPIGENADLGKVEALAVGYAQSKWVAERLVRMAAARGVPVAVYRPGRIGADSAGGRGNPDDLLFRVIGASLRLGAAPDVDVAIEMSPVDWVSRALVHLSGRPQSLGSTFHLVSREALPWHQLLAWLEERGHPLRRLPWNEWRRQLARAADAGADQELVALRSLFGAPDEAGDGEEDVTEYAEPRFDCRRTAAALEGSGLRCPPLDRRLIEGYLAAAVAAAPPLQDLRQVQVPAG
jgi:amino acid adenylation domain-containing protein/thioester reductase-like protein